MKQFSFNNFAANLPDCYNKQPESNNFKILAVEQEAAMSLRRDIADTEEILDIDKATGKTLSLYGDMVGQARGLATEKQFLIMIRSKIMRNISGGDYNSILRAISATFGCKESDIFIQETAAPLTVEIVSLPLDVLNSVILSNKQTVELIKHLFPVCVTIKTVYFDGTFMFSDNEGEIDLSSGFGDSDNKDIGGYFGDFFSEENEIILPI
ncbi:MAG TPA: hypothetical protein DD391_00660 [Clostridiales bacterium]|nr:hypothetical protein [Clostridiales bacterium]HBL81117.1 hypothetical protein [Clostridiales bacterium]